jgi:hypothetical protein
MALRQRRLARICAAVRCLLLIRYLEHLGIRSHETLRPCIKMVIPWLVKIPCHAPCFCCLTQPAIQANNTILRTDVLRRRQMICASLSAPVDTVELYTTLFG